MRTINAAIATILVTIVASPLEAGNYKKYDQDGDGQLSREEMRRAHEQRFDKMFNRLDADGDMKVSPAEMKKGKAKWRKKMQNRRIRQD